MAPKKRAAKKSVSKKRVAKKAVVKKKIVAKKATSIRATDRGAPRKKAVAKKKAAKKASGYRANPGGKVLVRTTSEPQTVVAPSKIQAGLAKARGEIQGIAESLESFSDGLQLSEIELQVSFSADGKFLGVGVGGATTITIKLKPTES